MNVLKKIETPLTAFYLAFSVLLYTPFLLLLVNKAANPFSVLDTALALGICLAVIPIVHFVCTWEARAGKLLNYFTGSVTLYVIVAVTIYPFQAGPLDGRVIQIAKSDYFGHLLLAVACFFIHLQYRDTASRITQALGVSSVVLVLSTMMFMPKETVETQNLSKIYTLGKSNNIIIVEMDMYQGYFVRNYLQQHPEIANNFEGFTFYENAVSAAPFTTMSVRNTLTGKIPIAAKGDGALIDQEDNLLADATHNGYLASYVGPAIPVVSPGLYSFNANTYFGHKFDFFAFALTSTARFFPAEFLPKARNPVEFGWLSKIDAKESLQWFVNNIRKDPGVAKSFLFFHSLMTHQPIRFTLRGEHDVKLSSNDLYQEIGFSLQILAQFIGNVKNTGAYNDTTIIFMGDHGYNILNKFSKKTLPPEAQYLRDWIGKMQLGQYDVALMVKPRQASGNLKYTKAAVVLTDLRRTLLEIMNPGSGAGLPGFDILKEALPEERDVVVLTIIGEEPSTADFQRLDNWEPMTLRLPLKQRR